MKSSTLQVRSVTTVTQCGPLINMWLYESFKHPAPSLPLRLLSHEHDITEPGDLQALLVGNGVSGSLMIGPHKLYQLGS